MKVKGKKVLITGTNRGIGLEIVRVFLENGATVIANYREKKDNLDELKKRYENLLLIKADVSKLEDVKSMFNKIKSEVGKIDVLVNNAGVLKDNLLMMVKEQELNSLLDTNVKGTYFCMQQAAKMMMLQGGSIINISSIVGVEGNAGQTAYSASKSAIIGLTKSAAKELGQFNIRVNALAPGLIKTDMSKHLKQEIIDNFTKRTALRKLGTPEEVADAVLFLASDKSKFITGHVLSVDGGLSM